MIKIFVQSLFVFVISVISFFLLKFFAQNLASCIVLAILCSLYLFFDVKFSYSKTFSFLKSIKDSFAKVIKAIKSFFDNYFFQPASEFERDSNVESFEDFNFNFKEGVVEYDRPQRSGSKHKGRLKPKNQPKQKNDTKQ